MKMKFLVIIMIAIFIKSAASFIWSREKTESIDEDDDYDVLQREDIPDKYYDGLVKELPEVSQILTEFDSLRTSYESNATRDQTDDDLKHINLQNDDFSNSTIAVPQSGRRLYTRWPHGITQSEAYGKGYAYNHGFVFDRFNYLTKKTKPVATCYWCGMNITQFVPTQSYCHDVFESQDGRMRTLQRFFRAKCYNVKPTFINYGISNASWVFWQGNFQGWNNFIYGGIWRQSAVKWPDKQKWGTAFYWDHGLKRNFFGQYTGGCFKRYLDVGNLYTQRGCRHYWPARVYGANSVAHRFRKLEYVLRHTIDGCVVSTHASLTPFNRGISLFARYHVCVCNGSYCNLAVSRISPNNILLPCCSLALLILTLIRLF